MKKVAFILAITLVFLVGITTVLKHKIWAKGEEGKTIVLWIPINEDGEAVLERVKPEIKFEKYERGLIPLPMTVDDWQEIHNIKNATVIKFKKNPYCYTICSEGACIERCIP